MEQKSDGEKSEGATEQRSDIWTERRSDGATERHSYRATEQQIDGAIERQNNEATERQNKDFAKIKLLAQKSKTLGTMCRDFIMPLVSWILEN